MIKGASVIAIGAMAAIFVQAVVGEHGHGHGHEEHGHGHFQPYGFGYDVQDGHGNTQYRHEKGTGPWEVKGSYGYKDAHGVHRHVDYVADKGGFRAHIKTNEPGTAPKDPAAVKMDSHPQPAGHGSHGHGHGSHGGEHKSSYHKQETHGHHYAAASHEAPVYNYKYAHKN
ncbi:Cuticle protein 16.8 [Halotydeus destructor]|nr:Cuticle protein 16.8 [Halotydeus destructor]